RDGEAYEGVNLFVPLGEQGVKDVLSGAFAPQKPEPHQVVRADAPLAGLYHWGFAGLTKPARRDIMQFSAAGLAEIGPHVPVFARGATEQGEGAIRSLGMEPLDAPIPNLFVSFPPGWTVEGVR
ncbi:MAG: hypothetical protein MI723_14230, partial [Caulobacterales bacterium]|nr:hypothetical protein [Caulobacterales bacterium]